MDQFYAQVYELLRQIPYGKVVSYGQLARALGRPYAARQVGRAMRCCKLELPCHRVVMADGSVCGGADARLRMELLQSEGVSFLPDGRVDMARHRWSIS